MGDGVWTDQEFMEYIASIKGNQWLRDFNYMKNRDRDLKQLSFTRFLSGSQPLIYSLKILSEIHFISRIASYYVVNLKSVMIYYWEEYEFEHFFEGYIFPLFDRNSETYNFEKIIAALTRETAILNYSFCL